MGALTGLPCASPTERVSRQPPGLAGARLGHCPSVAADSPLSTDALALLIVLDEASEKDGRVEVAGVAPKLVLGPQELQRAIAELEQRRLVRPLEIAGWYRLTDKGRQRLGPGGVTPSAGAGAAQDEVATVASRWRRGLARIWARARRRGS